MNPFTEIFVRKPQKNNFDLSHDRKFSLNQGDLVPILVQEVIPGDRFNLQSQHMLRMAPLVSPVMHEINAYTHYFFVPNRLLWNGWEDFITGGEDGYANPEFPYVHSGHGEGDLGDYLGLPFMNRQDIKVSALPFKAYHLIYDEYYRDQNLQTTKSFMPAVDGDNNGNMPADWWRLKKRAWEHDYFTSALPFAQKGPEVILPLGQTANLTYTGVNQQLLKNTATGATSGLVDKLGVDAAGDLEDSDLGTNLNLDISGSHKVDLSTATSSTVNELRKAFKLQEWLEANARGGSRYIEHIWNLFGVKSSDARLQRPEYLGGGKSTVSISEVLQTSGSPSETGYTPTPLGEMGGHGINVGNSNDFTASFEEHGYIIGIMSIRPRSAYSQGIPKHFNKFDKFDYFYQQFANIGEQEIKNKEIYVDDTILPNDLEGTFGYVPRYSEYRFNNSTVHGAFRSTLEYWQMGRKFANLPALNEEFIKMEEINRIFAYEGSDVNHYYCHIYFKVNALRPLPLYNVPQI